MHPDRLVYGLPDGEAAAEKAHALLDGVYSRIVADGTHAGLMATEPRYAEVLAHIEEDDASRRARAEEYANRAAQRAELADAEADRPQAAGLGDLV